MSYFLKKTTPSSKGEYLQIYEGYYISKVGKRNKSYKKLGYISDLKAQGIEDPIAYYQKEVDRLNSESKIIAQIGETSTCKFAGHFLIKNLIDKLKVTELIDLMFSHLKIQYKMSDLVKSLVYAQLVSPGSKLKAFEKVIPNLYGAKEFSYDQIIDGAKLIGTNYEKFIELFNQKIRDLRGIDTSKTFFDCTNYYFEIDLEGGDRKKGYSKENRHDPIIGQALLLDSNQIPIGMQMYPGNESELPYLRNSIENMKTRYDISGKTIQVADKGLNCARNIYAAVKEANDGYIFSKSVHGTNLSDLEKKRVLLSDDNANKWHQVRDDEGKLLYEYKYCIDTFEYSLDEEGLPKTFRVKEKRIVTYNPSLAKKQRLQILKEVEKAKEKISIKALTKDKFGDCSKYVTFEAKDEKGKKVKIAKEMNQSKIDEDLQFAGYNMIVTSELNMEPQEIYDVYHGLWRIEESFRTMKTYLEARPVFMQTKEGIYGHFLIVYIALVLMRLLEFRILENKISVSRLFDFIRDYRITNTGEGSYINNATNTRTYLQIKDKFGLIKLGNLILKDKDLDKIFNFEMRIILEFNTSILVFVPKDRL